MAGTRTASTIDGSPTTRLLSVRWIDASGDVRSDSVRVPAATTDIQLEALVAALVAGSNASLHGITVSDDYQGVADAQNAEVGSKSESIYDQLAFTAKHDTDPDKRTKRVIFPAPEAALFVGTTDTLDPANAETIALLAAFLTAIGAGWSVVHGTYTERSEVNERVKI